VPRSARRTLDPALVPAYVNLADLYRALGADTEAEETLRAGLAQGPDSAALHQAIDPLKVRQKQPQQAISGKRRRWRRTMPATPTSMRSCSTGRAPAMRRWRS
jgi:uncharacterized protein HemY